MAEEVAIAEVMNLLEADPSGEAGLDVVPATQFVAPNIPVLREQRALLVSTGNAKEAIGRQLTHE